MSLAEKGPTSPWRNYGAAGAYITNSCKLQLQKSIVVKFIKANYPQTQWTHAYTDGSTKRATENGGGGVYIKLRHKVHTISIATGKNCKNFKAETAALTDAAIALREHYQTLGTKW